MHGNIGIRMSFHRQRQWLLETAAFSLILFNAALILGQDLDEEGGAKLPGKLPDPENITDPRIRDLLTPNGLDAK